MTDSEEEIMQLICRSAADRAEVLTNAVRQNLKYRELDMVAITMQEVASLAWGVAGGEDDPHALLQAARAALQALDVQSCCTVERQMLRMVIDTANEECKMTKVPDDAFVPGAECLTAHMADLEIELEGGGT